jgi:outer membrane protein TolC
MEQAVRLALSRHPSVTKALQVLAASEQSIAVGRASYYPAVSVGGSYGRIGPVPAVDIPGRPAIEIYPENNYDVHVGLSQTIYDFGRTDASVELARSGRQLAADNLEQVRANLAYRTMSVFNAILILRRNVVVLDSQISDLTQHLEATRKRVQAGTSTDFDALTTEVRIAAARSEKIDAANALEGQEIQFRQLAGLGSREPVMLKGEFSSATLYLEPDSLLEQALRQRPEMSTARAQERSAGLQTRLSSLGKKPSLALSLTSGFKNGYAPDLNEMKANFFAGVQAEVPVFDGHRTRSRTLEAEADLLAAKANAEDLEKQIAAEVEQATAGARASHQKIENAELQVIQAEEAVSMAQTRYEAGVATNLDVLDAQTALTQARLSRLRALYNYAASLMALDRATGRRYW